MSDRGKFLRGLKWYNHRNIDGVLPTQIADDENKMVDVQFYLDNKEKTFEEEDKEVEEEVVEDEEEEKPKTKKRKSK